MTNTNASQLLKNLVSGYSGKIILVAHSMGALVAADYLRTASMSQRGRTVLITLGATFTGAPKALQGMENGNMFPGIPFSSVSSYVQGLICNIPAAYELLPTKRAETFVQVNGVDQTNTSAWSIMAGRSWAKNQAGRLKPMFSNAQVFNSNLLQSNGLHYAQSAGSYIFISNIGYSTIQKVNYSLRNGTYSVSSFVSTNNGDGTVLASSAQDGLSDNNSHVAKLSNGGLHAAMVNNPNTLTRVMRYVNQAINGYSLTSSTDTESRENTYVNEKGWVVGDNIDGRRIRVIIRGNVLPQIVASDGCVCTVVDDCVFHSRDDEYTGSCWEVADGYQLELLNDDYTLSFCGADNNKGISVEISYMENGYYQSMETYNLEDGAYEVDISSYEKSEINLRSQKGEYISPDNIADNNMLEALNSD